MPLFPSNINLSSLNGGGFKLSGAAEGDVSGRSVASAGDVNGDGFDDLIVGADGADPNGYSSGASYVVFGKAGGFGVNVNLSSLDGTNGFKLSGTATGDLSGWSVASAGDVNGDGFDDLIVGAYRADPNGSSSGASYVVFGKAGGFGSNVDLSSLDGSNGFKLSGAAADDRSGRSVASAGDVNGDGFADLIVGAPFADPNGDRSGASYVVFGKTSGFTSNIDLSSLDGNTGFRLSGAAAIDNSGSSVASAGDVNGDGFADLIVGAPGADANDQNNSGAAYVVFGKASGFAPNIDLSSLVGGLGPGATGFKLSGVAAGNMTGVSVASAGDVNGDGFDDLIVGARYGNSGTGASYVVFGKATFTSDLPLQLLNGTAGFRIDGAAAGDQSGYSVASAGDVNGDGFDDLIVGARTADPNDVTDSGASYVVFGKAGGFAPSINVSSLNGTNGFRLSGVAAGDRSGRSVASAGDVNGDGFADLIIGAYHADAPATDTGASYVVFGGELQSAVILIGTDASDTLDGGNLGDTLLGFLGDDQLYGNGGNDTLIGGDGNDALLGGAGDDLCAGGSGTDAAGFMFAAGAVTVDLLIAGAQNTGEGNDTLSLIEVVIGSDFDDTILGSNGSNLLDGLDGDDMLGGRGGDDTLFGDAGNDRLNGGLGNDEMTGGQGDDIYHVNSAGDEVHETAGGGTDRIITSIGCSLAGSEVENLQAAAGAPGLSLTGSDGANRITGAGGGDTITGGAGRDIMTGGGGGDTFKFLTLSDSVVGGGRDLIRDFTAGLDKIDLEAIDANSALADDQAFSFIGNAAFSHTAGELRTQALGANTLVAGDVDGNGTADFQILLSGSVTLQASDFLL